MSIALATSAGLATGCSANKEYLDRGAGFGGTPVTGIPVEAVPAKGFSVRVIPNDGADIKGELLAAETQYVHVKTFDPDQIVSTLWTDIEEVRIELAPSRSGEPAGSIVWTVVGTLSTLSHGYFLVFSIPTWLGTGIPTSILHAHAERTVATPEEVKTQLAHFARFPQGLPPSMLGPDGVARMPAARRAPEPTAPPATPPTATPPPATPREKAPR